MKLISEEFHAEYKADFGCRIYGAATVLMRTEIWQWFRREDLLKKAHAKSCHLIHAGSGHWNRLQPSMAFLQ